MKTILYMATSIDGFVAKKDDNTNFVSEIEWNSFRAMMKKVGNIIIGRRTFELMEKGGELPDLDEVTVVVITNNEFSVSDSRIQVVNSPRQAVDLLRKSFKQALVAGGGKINAVFMEQGLIDEVYLDIEPIALGDGIKLFSGKAFNRRLKLLGIKHLSENELQLHYRVLNKKQFV